MRSICDRIVARAYFRRLAKGDFEGLASAHQKVAEVIGALRTTNWAGAGPCSVLLGDVDRFLCGLYNKTESSLRASLGLPIADPPGQSDAAAAAESVSDQGPKAEGQD